MGCDTAQPICVCYADRDLAAQGFPAGVLGSFGQFGFDAQQLVVFRNPVRAGGGAGLDLAHVQGNDQVGDG